MEKHCPRCGASHEKAGTFCSRKCANSRTFSDASKAKKSASAKAAYQADPGLASRCTDGLVVALSTARYNQLMSDDIEMMSKYRRRKRVIHEQNGCCIRCGISEWMKLPIVLELDHIDGNPDNNARENLRALCPNCHSQTETWKVGHKPHWKHRMPL